MQDFVSLKKEVERQFPSARLQLNPDMHSCSTGLVQYYLLAVLSHCWPDVFEKSHQKLADCLGFASTRRKEAFDLLCDLASMSRDEPPELEHCQASTRMVTRGCDDQLEQFRGVIKYSGHKLTFFHSMIRAFLAALHCIEMPAMSAIKSLTSQLFELKDKSMRLSPDVALTIMYFFGASETGLSAAMPVTLQHLIGLVCLNVDGSQPVQDDLGVDIVVLAMKCAFEAHDPNLCKFIDKEYLTSHTLVINEHELDTPVMSYYMFHTTQREKYWTVYCSDPSLVNGLKEDMKRLGGWLIVKGIHILSLANRQKLVLSTRSFQYLQTTVKVFQTAMTAGEKGGVVAPTLPIYGYQTAEQYQRMQQTETTTYFNVFKDTVLPLLQLHSPNR